jgi:hypothetical protein
VPVVSKLVSNTSSSFFVIQVSTLMLGNPVIHGIECPPAPEDDSRCLQHPHACCCQSCVQKQFEAHAAESDSTILDTIDEDASSCLKVVDPLSDEKRADHMHLDVKKVKPQFAPRLFPKSPGPRALPPVLVQLEHLHVCCCCSCEAKIEVVVEDDGMSEEVLLVEPPASSLKLEVVIDDDGDDNSLCCSDDSASDRCELFEGRRNNESGSDSSANFEFPSELVFDTLEEFLRAEPPTNSLKLEVNVDDNDNDNDDDNDDDSLFEFPSELAFDLSHRQEDHNCLCNSTEDLNLDSDLDSYFDFDFDFDSDSDSDSDSTQDSNDHSTDPVPERVPTTAPTTTAPARMPRPVPAPVPMPMPTPATATAPAMLVPTLVPTLVSSIKKLSVGPGDRLKPTSKAVNWNPAGNVGWEHKKHTAASARGKDFNNVPCILERRRRPIPRRTSLPDPVPAPAPQGAPIKLPRVSCVLDLVQTRLFDGWGDCSNEKKRRRSLEFSNSCEARPRKRFKLEAIVVEAPVPTIQADTNDPTYDSTNDNSTPGEGDADPAPSPAPQGAPIKLPRVGSFVLDLVQTRLFDGWGRDCSKKRKRHQSRLRKQVMLEVLFVVPTIRADTPSCLDTLDSSLDTLDSSLDTLDSSLDTLDSNCNSAEDSDSNDRDGDSYDRDGDPATVPTQQPLRRSARIAAIKIGNSNSCQVLVEQTLPRSARIAASGIRRSARLAAKARVNYSR